jgi:hypothetical protein
MILARRSVWIVDLRSIFKTLYFLSAVVLNEQINHMFLLCFCSVFSLIFLHFFLYGCNIFAWRKTRINYRFIFEIVPTKELKYKDVFLICTMSMTSVVGVLLFHLTLLTKGYSYAQVQFLLGLIFLVSSWFCTLHQLSIIANHDDTDCYITL